MCIQILCIFRLYLWSHVVFLFFLSFSVPATFKIPFFALALPMSILLGIVVFIMEWFWPWTKDTDSIHVSIFAC